MYNFFNKSKILKTYITKYDAFHLCDNNHCQNDLNDVQYKVIAYTYIHARKIQESIDSRASCEMARVRTGQREEGGWKLAV